MKLKVHRWQRFAEGQRVKVLAFEGEPVQYGAVEGYVYVVRLDQKFRDRDDPDGLREVDADQLEAIAKEEKEA